MKYLGIRKQEDKKEYKWYQEQEQASLKDMKEAFYMMFDNYMDNVAKPITITSTASTACVVYGGMTPSNLSKLFGCNPVIIADALPNLKDYLKVKEFKDAHPIEGERELMLFKTIKKLSNF